MLYPKSATIFENFLSKRLQLRMKTFWKVVVELCLQNRAGYSTDHLSSLYNLRFGQVLILTTHHIINMPNITHCGLSISMGIASSSSSSGKTGASLSTVVSRLTVETVTSKRNAVSTNEHLLTGLQCKMEVPRGIKMAALAQSTMAWWKRRPWLHLRAKWILLWLIKAVHNQVKQQSKNMTCFR